MDYLGDKLNSFTGEAVTGINEYKRKRQAQQKQQTTECATELESMPMKLHRQPLTDHSGHQATAPPPPPPTTGVYGFDLSRIQSGPLSGGMPFGGDSGSAPPPPPVGFRLLAGGDKTQPFGTEDKKSKAAPEDEGSSLSLYEGDTWSRMWFQRVMILTLIRLMLFIRKIYEDFFAFRLYRVQGLVGHCLISATTLLLPTIVFTIYRIARYLQIALPAIRLADKPQQPDNAANDVQQPHKSSKDQEDAQSRRALMSSPTDSLQQQKQQQQLHQQVTDPIEEDGLETARQTPTNITEEFHDTQSEQQIQLESARAAAKNADSLQGSGRKSHEPKLESVNVNKLGNIADKQSTRIALGASEQLLHGILFIFWQLKRQVDIVGYLVERACLWRKAKEAEKQQLSRLRFSGDGLEWFQDFYAAFLAILVQVYTLGTYWSNDGLRGHNANSTAATNTSGIRGTDLVLSAQSNPLGAQNDLPQGTVSNIVRFTSSISGLANSGDFLITSEIVVSCMVVTSLLVAVRRQDDGPLTLGLSMIGWGTIFAARIIVIALAFVHIGWLIMLPLVVCHIAAISVWIYKIALDSHNGKAGESEEHRWAPPAIEDAPERQTVEPAVDSTDLQATTSTWSIMEHLTLICQIVTLFAIPSLFYWPIMFNLKLHARPFKYLALILSENFLLIAAIWYHISSTTSASAGQLYLLGTVGACSIVGFIFISLYIACKPSLTEYFARADEIINEAEKSGIYYEFCSRVFKMPDLTKHAFTRLMNQQEFTVVETEEYDKQSLAEVQLD